MSFKTKDLKMTFLGVIPILQDETGSLKPQDIVALSALMTFKGKTVKELYQDVVDKGQNIDERVKKIIKKSSLRGHASIATTPAICFTYEASKFIDSMMTGAVFSSSLMASGRRTNTTIDDIVYPDSIDQKTEAKKKYKEISEKNIIFLNKLLEAGIEKDEASKILQYGIYGTGIIAYPIESIVAFKKEIELEKDWMPEEGKMVVQKIEKYLKTMGLDLIYASRELAARNVYPMPNIFKDPQKNNITRDLVKQKPLPKELTKILDFSLMKSSGFEKAAGQVVKLQKEIMKDPKVLKKRWRELLEKRYELMRDWQNVVSLKILSSVSWRVWSEKKRHRTVPMVPDSVYYSLERTKTIFKKYNTKILQRKLTKNDLKIIDRCFTLPYPIRENQEFLYEYLERVRESIEVYFELVEKYKISPSDALYLMPRGIRIDLFQEYNLFNLISGYYPLRTCQTAEAQLRQISRLEMIKIKQFLKKKGLTNIEQLMVTKCHIPGFCLEEKNCPIINGLFPKYDESWHEEMKKQLDDDFEEKLKNLK
ncbi:MAG: FAD-dependent thymidylate synthase [Patescibacteria group bacterium]|nr:FAD-dependent thymidylate synthase [Patescibacteria group bacterium]